MRWRLIFWPLFVVVALTFGLYAWNRGVEHRCQQYIKLMGHPQANISAQAWQDLRVLYFTKWAAVNYILDHLDDDRPISFLVEREKGVASANPDVLGFTTHNHPIYYRTDRVWCRTVRDSILAFMYDERKWKVDFNGDWQKWWDANRGYYGRP